MLFTKIKIYFQCECGLVLRSMVVLTIQQLLHAYRYHTSDTDQEVLTCIAYYSPAAQFSISTAITHICASAVSLYNYGPVSQRVTGDVSFVAANWLRVSLPLQSSTVANIPQPPWIPRIALWSVTQRADPVGATDIRQMLRYLIQHAKLRFIWILGSVCSIFRTT